MQDSVKETLQKSHDLKKKKIIKAKRNNLTGQHIKTNYQVIIVISKATSHAQCFSSCKYGFSLYLDI